MEFKIQFRCAECDRRQYVAKEITLLPMTIACKGGRLDPHKIAQMVRMIFDFEAQT